MHEFRFKNKRLYCENVEVKELAERFGTPLYVYSYETIMDHFLKLKHAFKDVSPLICFSMKSNSNLAILKSLVDKGAGLDVVSGGELFRALKVGCERKKIVYASVGKTEEEIKQAIREKILLFNVESEAELKTINRVAKELAKIVDVSLRINPHVTPKTHQYIKTGHEDTKFGVDINRAKEIFLKRFEFEHLNLIGIHMHIGSQITESRPFVAALKKIQRLIECLQVEGVELEWLNIGGGLGIVYRKEKPQTAQIFSRAVVPLLKQIGLKVILEPGRFVVGNAGILVTKVLYTKETASKRFVIIDAGMNDLLRPALYGAYHTIVPIEFKAQPLERAKKCDIVGPVCESGDFLGKDRALPKLKPGEYLAVMGAGAYGFSMSSNYNSRRRAAEVMVLKERIFVVRRRETYDDLIRHEAVPAFLSGL